MDDQHSGGAAARGFLILVGPAAVIGHRLAAEVAFAAFEVGVVDEDDDQLAAHVDVLEVVPVSLGRGHSVAGEDQRDVGEVDRALAVERSLERDLVTLGELERLAVAQVERELRVADNLGFEQRHVLEPAALAADDVAAGLEADRLHLVGDIIDRLGLGPGRRPAALERVGRDELVDIGQPLGANAAGGRGSERDCDQRDCARGEKAEFRHGLYSPQYVRTRVIRRTDAATKGCNMATSQRASGSEAPALPATSAGFGLSVR